MAYYLLYDSERNLLGVHPGPLPALPPGISYETNDEKIPDLNAVRWNPETLSLEPVTSTAITRLEFMSRFTPEERIAVRASQDPVVQDIMNLLNIAEFINPKDPQTVQSINYLAAKGLLTPERTSEVLS